MRKGDLIAAKLQKNGNYYGRRLDDFKGADYVIVDVTLSGLNDIKRKFPNTFSVYLEPVEDPAFIRKRLLKRGDMSMQEARKRSEIIPSHIESSKAMDFDLRIQTRQGQFDAPAKEISDMIPRVHGPIANPSKKITSVRIEESPNKEKKMVAYFFDEEGKKVRTTHFGARGMSDFTQHKDPKRMKRYLARHSKMGEDWKDPTTAGALSRWILWGKPSLRESFNDYKKKFRLEGVMTVTNTRMNARRIPEKYEGQDPSEHSDLYTDEDPKGTIQGLGFKDKATAEKSVNIIKKSGKPHAHKIQAAMAMEQRARFHPNATKGIEDAQKVYANFIEEMKEKTKAMRNPEDCPPATQSLELNTKNRNKAIQADYIRYGPLNLSDLKYYEDAAAHWKTTVETAKKSKCSNCVAFDISPRMLDCMPGPVSEPIEDEDGYLGYCWMHHFKCHSARTCFTWAAGGPINKDKVSHEWQERAFGTKNPKTPGGKTFPKRYLTGLNKEERAIAMKEIDQGYKYDTKDPKAYEYWKSDIKATARGYKTVPSKYKKKFIEMYGPMPEKGDFITKISKATKIKKSIIQKVYDKGLAAWRVGHRPGVRQHQWAAGRVYSFVTLGNTVKKGKRKMGDYKLAVEAGLIKDNPKEPSADDFFPGNTNVAHPSLISPTISITSLQNPNEWRHGAFAEDDPFEEYF